MNLNEDPMLDRKVQYDIKPGEALYCGRRNKNSSFKLQLGGTGILPEHCKFSLGPNETSLYLTPLDPKAIAQIRINGIVFPDMNDKKLLPNDRIGIGPSALFIYKNKKVEHEAIMEDTEENPITHEMAADEVIEAENVG